MYFLLNQLMISGLGQKFSKWFYFSIRRLLLFLKTFGCIKSWKAWLNNDENAQIAFLAKKLLKLKASVFIVISLCSNFTRIRTHLACMASSAKISVFSFSLGAAGRADGGRAVFKRPGRHNHWQIISIVLLLVTPNTKSNHIQHIRIA